jgi:hypothetical protein
MGSSTVPRTAATCRLNRLPSDMVRVTVAVRTPDTAGSGTSVVRAISATTSGLCMRSASCAMAKVNRRSSSDPATRYCTLMSGMSRLSTTCARSPGSTISMAATSSGAGSSDATRSSAACTAACAGEPTANFLMFVDWIS